MTNEPLETKQVEIAPGKDGKPAILATHSIPVFHERKPTTTIAQAASIVDDAWKSIRQETPQTAEFLSELRRKDGGTKRNWPEGLLQDGRPVQFFDFDLAVQNVASRCPLSPEEVERLLQLEDRADTIREESKRFDLSRTTDHLHALRDQVEADVLSGKPLSDTVTTPSREAVQRDFLAKSGALHKALLRITHDEIVPAVRPILERFDSVLEEFLIEVEVGDRFVCESYGLDYEPSVLWKALALIAQRFSIDARLPKSHAFATPRQLLQGIVAI